MNRIQEIEKMNQEGEMSDLHLNMEIDRIKKHEERKADIAEWLRQWRADEITDKQWWAHHEKLQKTEHPDRPWIEVKE